MRDQQLGQQLVKVILGSVGGPCCGLFCASTELQQTLHRSSGSSTWAFSLFFWCKRPQNGTEDDLFVPLKISPCSLLLWSIWYCAFLSLQGLSRVSPMHKSIWETIQEHRRNPSFIGCPLQTFIYLVLWQYVRSITHLVRAKAKKQQKWYHSQTIQSYMRSLNWILK